MSVTAAALRAAPERPRLEDEAGEHGHRQQDVGGQAARAREDPEGRVSHREASGEPRAPVGGDEDARQAARVGLANGSLLAGEEERLRPDLGLDGVGGDDGQPQQVAVGRACRSSGRSGGGARDRSGASAGGRGPTWRARRRRARA